MTAVDQNSMYTSMRTALVPGDAMIDGRTEAERLNFLNEFSKLINFYDNTNTVNGSWSPFLLKDPVFLTAHISQTDTARLYKPYYNACVHLQKAGTKKLSQKELNAASVAFNQVFDQLMLAYMHVERWTYYMQLSDEHYELKDYLVREIKSTFSPYFWAILSLQQYLFTTSAIPGIEKVYYYLFEGYDQLTWQQGKNKSPFWELLQMSGIWIDITSENALSSGLQVEIAKAVENDPKLLVNGKFHYLWENPPFALHDVLPGYQDAILQSCFSALKAVSDEFFNFFHTIVYNAADELKKLNKMPSRYPDTTLLRTFTDLLRVQQDQLNGLTGKHLDFYYRDILKQGARVASPDTALLFAGLPPGGSAYVLPAGTAFSGGTDANKNPVVFSTTENTSLNPAVIASAYTLCLWPSPQNPNLQQYYLQPVLNPGQLQTDENGAAKSWPTFGPSLPATLLQPATLAFAFASPMLLLNEGQRTIFLTLNYSGTISPEMLSNAGYYLSSATAWQQLVFNNSSSPDLNHSSVMVLSRAAQTITLRIDLPSSQPAIQAFTKNPDGLSSPWPMFKIVYNGVDNPAQPPLLTSLTINTLVTGLSGTLQLYNDSGAISTKNPYLPFGPVPLVNSNFIIGSSEIFSKPVSALSFSLNWNNLPSDFGTYYFAYNQYFSIYPYVSGTAASAASASTAALNGEGGSVSTQPAAGQNTEPADTTPPVPVTPNTASAPGMSPTSPAKKGILSFIAGLPKNALQKVNDSIASVKKQAGAKVEQVKKSFNRITGKISAAAKRLWSKVSAPVLKVIPTVKTTLPETTVTTDVQASPNPDYSEMFNNVCFLFECHLLAQNSWQEVTLTQLNPITGSATDITFTSNPYTPGLASNTQPAASPPPRRTRLFGTTNTTTTTTTTTGTTTITTTSTTCTLVDSSFFSAGSFPQDDNMSSFQTPLSQFATVDPGIQYTNQKYTETSADGFMKMTLTTPVVGFGSAVYANVVSWVAMQNAIFIKNAPTKTSTQPPPPLSPSIPPFTYDIPNPPFSPKLSALTANYFASQTYDLTSPDAAYPLQCFLYTPFENVLLYDNSLPPSPYMNQVVTNLCGVNPNAGAANSETEPGGLTLYPTFAYEGALYLGLQNLVAPNLLNLYFQVAKSYSSISGLTPPDFYYLGQTGWNVLNATQDTTNDLCCPGIITLDIPEDITNQSNAMPLNNYWIAACVKDNPASYSQTVLVNTNGFSVQRSGSTFLTSLLTPSLAAGSITKPVTAIPQVKTVSQPFPSFGGAAAETPTTMNLRVSNRLKTKDRAVSSEDYYRLIQQKFNTIYYVKSIYDRFTFGTTVYVAKGAGNWQEPGAFVPLVNDCELEEIQNYLSSRTSAFANVTVCNFELWPVTITATVTSDTGYTQSGIAKTVSQALNIYLSPWISASCQQVVIDQGLDAADIALFINSLPGVASATVNSISTLPGNEWPPVCLIVSSMNHQVNFQAA